MKRARILIVDQQGQEIQLMAKILDNAGFGAIRGVDALSEAARVCEEFQPHLVLFDVSSAGPDKVSLLRKIREGSRPDTMPSVFAFSADTSRQTRRRALASGADDFLTKPLDHTEFLLRCKNLIRGRLLRQQLSERIACLSEKLQQLAPRQNNQLPGFGTDSNFPWALS